MKHYVAGKCSFNINVYLLGKLFTERGMQIWFLRLCIWSVNIACRYIFDVLYKFYTGIYSLVFI